VPKVIGGFMDVCEVYWCIDSDTPRVGPSEAILPLFQTVVKDRNKETDPSSSYYKCKSAQELLNNTFILPNTRDLNISFIDGRMLSSPDSKYFRARLPVFDSGPAVDYDCRWLFFSEDDVSIHLTPPYYHNTTASKYGTLLSGEFNISKWFRPIVPTFSLWDNSSSLSISKGDPLAYVKFISDKKVVLREFVETDKIRIIMQECVLLKEKFPNLPLSESYNKFLLANKHKELIKEIRANLVRD